MESNSKFNKLFSTHGIANFKAFSELQKVELAPITLIYGQNSGGKSSFIQSILTLSQSKFEIGNGQIKFSGENTEAGTYESILNKSGTTTKDIIFEVSNKNINEDKENKSKYYVDAFDAINEYKIKYFISPSEDPIKGIIYKLEISFTGYLLDLPLVFLKDEDQNYRLEGSDRENYKLENYSISNLKIIYEKIFERLENTFKKFEDDQKGNLFSCVLEIGGISSEDLNFGVNFPFQILSFLRYAALKSNRWIDIKNDKIYMYSLKPKSKSKIDNQLNLIKSLSIDIYKVFENDLKNHQIEHFVYIKNKSDLIKSRKFLRFSSRNQRRLNNSFNRNADVEKINTDDQELNFWVRSKTHNDFVSKRDIYIKKLINLETDAKKTKINSFLLIHKEKCDAISKDINRLRKACKSITNNLEENLNEKISIKFKDEICNIKLNLFNKYINNISYYVKSILEAPQIKSDFDNYLIIYKYLDVLERTIDLIHFDIRKFKDGIKSIGKDEFFISDLFSLIYLRYNLETLINTSYYLQEKLIELSYFFVISEIFKDRENKDLNKTITKNSSLFLLQIDKAEYRRGFSKFYENFSDADFDRSLFYHRGFFDVLERGIQKVYRPQLRSIVDSVHKRDNTFYSYFPFFFKRNLCLPQQLTKKIIHLGPARAGAKRFYTSKDIDILQPNDVAYLLKAIPKGSNAENELKEILLNSKILSTIETSPFKDKTLDAKKIEVKTIESKNLVNIADTGYGISQILPIIYSAITNESNTIVVQQPETHLHPRLQAEVGTIICNSIKKRFDKNWIIETHSEILLLRILKLIRKGEINSNFLRIYYVDQVKNKGAVIKRMYISEKGELKTQWPEGFFSEDIDEIFDN